MCMRTLDSSGLCGDNYGPEQDLESGLERAAALVKSWDNLELDGINQFLPLGTCGGFDVSGPALYWREWSVDYTDDARA